MAIDPSGSRNASHEPALEVECFGLEPVGEARVAAMPGQAGHPSLRVEDVALDLGQGDRRLGEAAVEPSDRLRRVLPALVAQPGLFLPLVFDESVAVAIAPLVDPFQGGQRVRPVALDETRRRRSSRTSRRAGSARAASHRSSRSTERMAAPRSGPSRRSGARAGSCPAPRRATGPRRWPGARPGSPASRSPAAAGTAASAAR